MDDTASNSWRLKLFLYPGYPGDSFIVQLGIASLKLVVTVSFAFAPINVSPAFAQTSDAVSAIAPAASTPKQIRKAQRKAARAKKNAELKTLAKNGYQPGGDVTSYPQDLQNIEPSHTVPASG